MIFESLNSFSEFKDYVESLNQRLIAKGASVHSCQVREPATKEMIAAAEGTLALQFPIRTKRFLTEVCSGMSWNWTVRQEDERSLSAFFATGQCEWSLEAFSDTGLRDDLTETWGIADSDQPIDQLWRRSLMLAPVENDYLLIDPRDDWKIKVGGAGIAPREAANAVARDLPDLLDRWMPICGSMAIMHHCDWLQAPKEDGIDPSQMIRWLQV
jgi:hypothetical protein